MQYLKSIILGLLFLISTHLLAQNDSIYQPNDMIADFNYMHKHLHLNHPGVYRYTSKQTWDSIYKITLNSLKEPLPYVKYRLVLRSYLNYVKCGHTQVIPSKKSLKLYNKRKHKSIPFKVIIANDKIFVSENLSNDSDLVKGTEITAINGINVSNIISDIYHIQNADAGLNSMKNFYGASQFATYYNALYGEDSVFKISYIKLNGDTQTAVISERSIDKNKKNILKVKSNRNLFNQTFAQFRICEGDTQTAILKIKGFQLNNGTKFYSRAFEKIKSQDIKYLILDLRGNGGGSIVEAAELISYLSKDTFSYGFCRGTQGLTYKNHAKQKSMYYFSRILIDLFGNKREENNQFYYHFGYDKKSLKKDKHFNGVIFCLIDNGTFSAASFVAAYVKHKSDGIIIGQETAGTESGCYAVNTPFLELPNTKNFIRIPHYQFKHKLPIKDSERGILPQIETPINSQTINSENDEEIDLIWKIIFEKN